MSLDVILDTAERRGDPKESPIIHQEDPELTERFPGGAKWSETAPKKTKK